MKKVIRLVSKRVVPWIYGLYGLLICQLSFADASTDPLASTVKPQIEGLFGPTSTVAICIYIAEIIVGSVYYIKSKNLLTLIGVPILVLFTHSMFSYIGGTTS